LKNSAGQVSKKRKYYRHGYGYWKVYGYLKSLSSGTTLQNNRSGLKTVCTEEGKCRADGPMVVAWFSGSGLSTKAGITFFFQKYAPVFQILKQVIRILPVHPE
jgi:hypothetical protein